MEKRRSHIYILVAISLALASCGPSARLAEGSYILSANEIKVEGNSEVNERELNSYLKQQPSKSISIGSEPVVMRPELIASSEDNILKHLEYSGYYNAGVNSEVTYKRRKARVKYVVRPGERLIIDTIAFDISGNEDFIKDFLSDTASMTIAAGNYLSEAALEEEADRSSAVLRTKGYYGISKSYYDFLADTLSNPGHTSLVVRVDGMPKSRIGEVSISRPANLKFKDKILKELNTIHPGDLYNEEEINKTYSRLASMKLFNNIGIELTQKDSTIVDCSIDLSQTNLQGYKINFEASSNSTGLIGLSPQLSYFHKNIFRGGEWLNLSFLGNLQFNFNDPTKSNELGLSAGISFPKFLGLPDKLFRGGNLPRTEVKLSYNYQNRPEYTRNIVSASFGYAGTFWKNGTYQIFPFQLNYVRLSDIDERFLETLSGNPFMRYSYQDHFDAGIGGVLYFGNARKYIRLSFDQAGNVLRLFKPLMIKDEDGAGKILGAAFSQYVRYELTLAKSWSLDPDDRVSVAARFLAGIGAAYGNSSALPFEKQFYAGGANSLRGWQARSVGPGTAEMNNSFSIPSQSGDTKLEMNVELRYKLFWKLEGALFVDAGNIWTLQDGGDPEGRLTLSNFGRSIAADWGTGLRVNLNFLVLRIDAGFKFHDPSAADPWAGADKWFHKGGYALHFGVGYPF